MSIAEKLLQIKTSLPGYVCLVAVSKNQPAPAILEAYAAGQIVFGENRVQELISKRTLLPADIHWHMIGHLQTNKVKLLIPFIELIHSVDSEKLAAEINRQAALMHKKVNCLIQFYIATEDSKFGFDFEESLPFFHNYINGKYPFIRISGIMGMASFSDNYQLVRSEFKNLRGIYNRLKNDYFKNDDQFKEVSMGMSSDYKIAVDEGSTMVRIGTSIFGSRF